MARIFLTGGSGFIGSQLAQYAARTGHAVTVATAINNDAERRRCEMLSAAGVTVIVASLDEHTKMAHALRNHDAVIHLAAAQHEAEAGEEYFRRINVEGTRWLLEAAAAADVGRFVYGSTIGVYGSAAGEAVLDELSPLQPDNPYGRTKAAAEAVVRQLGSKIPVSIARISETYGPADLRLLKLFRGIARRRYVTLGSGRNEHQLIFVDDLARGLLLAAVAPAAIGETFVLAGTERLSTDEMATAVAAAVGRSDGVAHLPLWPFDIAAFMFETTFKPLGLRPPLHRRRLDFFRKSFRFSTAKAQSLLGFRSEVAFAEGARRTAEWYRANGFLR
jgi:nucleoside-diphosphate-sugar epimerase